MDPEHYLSAIYRQPDSRIICNSRRKLNLTISQSSYVIISSGVTSLVTQEVIDLPSVLCVGGQDFTCLGSENAPLSATLNQYFLNGVSFATTPASQQIMMEPYTETGDDKLSSLYFSDEIVCIASYNVFGHFLLQTCLKLLALKSLGRFDDSLVIFSGFLPKAFKAILTALDLLPKRFVLTPSASKLISAKACGLLLSPIHTVNTPLCNLIANSQDTLDPRLMQGQSLTATTWLNPRRGLNMHAAAQLRASVLNSATAKQSQSFSDIPSKLYLARKPGVHRTLSNRDQILSIIEHNGYQLLYLEDLRVEDQIKYLLACENLVCDVGSTSCNTWLMPHLQTVVELAISGSAIPWGPVLDSAVRPINFVRILGAPVPGTLKRFDGDVNKPPMAQDCDYIINPSELIEALDLVSKR